MDMIAAPSHLR